MCLIYIILSRIIIKTVLDEEKMTTNLFDLTDKVALVTGASRGIGEAIAKLLAEQGAHVIVSSRRAESCDDVVAAIIKAGGSAETMACHIGEMDNIAKTFQAINEKHGKLDVCLLYTSPSPRDLSTSRMPSSA